MDHFPTSNLGIHCQVSLYNIPVILPFLLIYSRTTLSRLSSPCVSTSVIPSFTTLETASNLSIYSKLVLKLGISWASTFYCHDYCYLLSVKLFVLNWVEDAFTGTILLFHSLLLCTLILMVCFCSTSHSSFHISQLSR